jgi:hypothetical protein
MTKAKKIPEFNKSETVDPPVKNVAAPNAKVPKYTTECFRLNTFWNNSTVSILFVPLFKQRKEDKDLGIKKYVGPGYWKPLETPGVVYEKPPFEYNTREYTKEELLRAGATEVHEYIWPRS